MNSISQNGYKGLKVFFGDLHNHCDLSYGRGSFDQAIRNARLQLDFASITIHALWPDLPVGDPKLDYLVDYHRKGFARAYQNWPRYLRLTEEHNEEGHFVTFPSFEWHSNQYGDHCVYFKEGMNCPILDARDLQALRQEALKANTPVFIIPHHIGYKQGSRGINWSAFSEELSPVVEIFSFHGLSESSEGSYPYLHTMGPRHELSTAQHGWEMGHIFGVIGSSDHHNAFPGSYGIGRLGVWAETLTREAIWNSIARRRTYALTGDRIELEFTLNGSQMGEICAPEQDRWIEVVVRGGDSIDYVDVLHNNQVIHRESVITRHLQEDICKIYFEAGWGEGSDPVPWDVNLVVLDGELLKVEPRFRGYGPIDNLENEEMAYTSWDWIEPNQVHLRTLTRQNPSIHTPATEGISLEMITNQKTRLLATVNGQQYEQPVSELSTGTRTHYLGGFVSPAFCFHRAVPQSEYSHHFKILHHNEPGNRDWYYVRVRQVNGQWAWSSPIWVEKSA